MQSVCEICDLTCASASLEVRDGEVRSVATLLDGKPRGGEQMTECRMQCDEPTGGFADRNRYGASPAQRRRKRSGLAELDLDCTACGGAGGLAEKLGGQRRTICIHITKKVNGNVEILRLERAENPPRQSGCECRNACLCLLLKRKCNE